MNRYSRQIVLPEVGDTGQQRLGAAKVLVVGAGALGAPVLQYLTGAGIGEISLVDPDCVDIGNLHRQTLYRMSDVGAYKATVAARAMQGLNPDVRFIPITEWLSPNNAAALVEKADVVLDCADNYAVSYILSDTCYRQLKPMISASVLGLEGYVGGFCGGAPSLRAVFPSPSNQDATCASAGVLGPVVGVLGSLQAQMTLRLLLGLQPSPLGQFIRMTADGRFAQFRFDGANECPGAYFISVAEVSDRDLVIDVRGEDEAPHLATPNAIRLPNEGVKGLVPTKNQRVVIACRSGLRAWRIAEQLATIWPGDIALLAMQTEA